MIEVLQDWNPWWNKKKDFVPRNLLGIETDLLNDVKQYLAMDRIVTLVGVRRAGKSTILYQIIEYLIRNDYA